MEKRRRQHRAAGGLVAPCDSVDVSDGRRARLAALAAARTTSCRQWHGACSAAIRTRSHAFHSSSKRTVQNRAGCWLRASLSEQLDDVSACSCLLVSYMPLGNPAAQKPAAAARTNVMAPARLGPSERYADESQTAARGSGRVASTSHKTHWGHYLQHRPARRRRHSPPRRRPPPRPPHDLRHVRRTPPGSDTTTTRRTKT